MSEANSEQQQFWDRRAGAWDRRAEALDAISDDYGRSAMNALAVQPGERVLEVGCGPGTTAVELAGRVGAAGSVTGVDISPGMVEAATRRAARAGLGNVGFVVADAQTDPLGEDFDAAFSRFGVMFFNDPVVAFANIGRALRPGGRLACVVWGPLADNPWMFVPTLAAAQVLDVELSMPEPGRPGPFSLDREDRVDHVLRRAGFSDIRVEPVEGVRHITSQAAGDDVTTLLEVGPLGEAYDGADGPTRRRAVEAVEKALDSYRRSDGWWLPGSAFLMTARFPDG